MKKTIYSFNSNANNTFCADTTNYSKILDDIITTNIIETNPYLHKYCTSKNNDFISNMMNDSAKKHATIIIDNGNMKDDAKLIDAANFLANYKKSKDIKSKFILGKTYKLIDGTPIIFFDDEIQIGFDLYSYDDFKNITFIKGLPKKTKSMIINIININL